MHPHPHAHVQGGWQLLQQSSGALATAAAAHATGPAMQQQQRPSGSPAAAAAHTSTGLVHLWQPVAPHHAPAHAHGDAMRMTSVAHAAAAADDGVPWKRQRTAADPTHPQPLHTRQPTMVQPPLQPAAGALASAFAPGYHTASSNWHAAAGMSWNAMAAPVAVAAAAPSLPPSRAEYRHRDQ